MNTLKQLIEEGRIVAADAEAREVLDRCMYVGNMATIGEPHLTTDIDIEDVWKNPLFVDTLIATCQKTQQF